MIIDSFLDTDFYKLTMGQFLFHYKPEQRKYGEYSMKCRNHVDIVFLKDKIVDELNHFLSLKPTKEELEYLQNLKINNKNVFQDDYLKFLENIELYNHVEIQAEVENGELNVRFKGDVKYSVYVEVPMLAIIQELYWNETYKDNYLKLHESFYQKLLYKIEKNKNQKFKFAEFGTRRRFSKVAQELAVKRFSEKMVDQFIGTSNVRLAMKYKLNPIGSHAHEFFQIMQGVVGYEKSVKESLYEWKKEYPDMLNIALTDIFGADYFFKIMENNPELVQHFTKSRQDSGNPYDFGKKFIDFYKKIGMPSNDKTVLFSDDLNFEKLIALTKYFKDDFISVGGVGTYCSNDTGLTPLNLIAKIVRLNGIDVLKLSDSAGKIMCENADTIKNVQNHIKFFLDGCNE